MKKFFAVMAMALAFDAAAGIADSAGTQFNNIVLASDAPGSVKLAASELRKYIGKACGSELPVVQDNGDIGAPPHMFVGQCRQLPQLGLTFQTGACDEFRIVSKAGCLAIFGNDYAGQPISGLRNPWRLQEVWNDGLKIGAFGSCGTLQGVYSLLETQFGIRWYMPGEIGEVVPASSEMRLPEFDVLKRPDFAYRNIWFADFADSPDDALWSRRLGLGGDRPMHLTHSFSSFLKYKDSHPEYFALVDGQRDFGFKCACGGGGHLCLSNPDVAAQWIKDIKEYFRTHPEQSVYPVMPNDGLNRICECAGCQADLSPALPQANRYSTHIWKFVRKVAEGVARECPGKFVGCCPYSTFIDPPADIDRLPPNVIVMICKGRLSYGDGRYHKEADARIDAWRKLADNIYCWEYYLNTWLPWRNLPVFPSKLISDDLKHLKAIGCKGEFIESESWLDVPAPPHNLRYPGMQHLNIYLTAKLYWNADQDIAPLLAEYYELFYGPAKEPMKSFWETAEKLYVERCASSLHAQGSAAGPTDVSPSLIYSKHDLDRLSAFLSQAVDATQAGSIFRRRVELVKGEFDAGRRMLVKLDRKDAPSMFCPAVRGGNAFAEVLKGRPQQFVDKTGEAAPCKTWLYTGWDDANLYFSFVCFSPDTSKLKAMAAERDQAYIWKDDCVEMYIIPEPASSECRQFIVNAKGVCWDGMRKVGRQEVDTAWNSSISAKVELQDGRWIVNVAIPWKDLGVARPEAGRRMSVNFYRTNIDGGVECYSVWSPIFTYGFFAPERFGALTLE